MDLNHKTERRSHERQSGPRLDRCSQLAFRRLDVVFRRLRRGTGGRKPPHHAAVMESLHDKRMQLNDEQPRLARVMVRLLNKTRSKIEVLNETSCLCSELPTYFLVDDFCMLVYSFVFALDLGENNVDRADIPLVIVCVQLGDGLGLLA